MGLTKVGEAPVCSGSMYWSVCVCLFQLVRCKSTVRASDSLCFHSTSDPVALWEQVKPLLIVHRNRGCLVVKCNAKNVVAS